MPVLLSCLTASLAAEPATVLYLLSGAVGLVVAHNRRKADRRKTPRTGPDATPDRRKPDFVAGNNPIETAMLFCRRATHDRFHELNLLKEEPTNHPPVQ